MALYCSMDRKILIPYSFTFLRFSTYESDSLRSFSYTVSLMTFSILRIKFDQIFFQPYLASCCRIYKYMLQGLKISVNPIERKE